MFKPANEVRASFLDFFKGKGHAVVPSSSLLPANDPTLMFTAAGMVQFKDVFTGKEQRPYTRATSSQKCIRISGKHNDLENVGVTARHHTFFEMLGNFSFGDYFKEDAIAWAWELITKVWGIPEDRLVVTVFGGENGVPADQGAREIWRKVTGWSDDLVIDMGAKDNFWQAGDTGPCGPCTEIHFWNGDGPRDLSKFLDEPPVDGRGWMEIWNLVFMQFDRDAQGTLAPLPKPCVDTGAGLERVSSVLQGKTSNYDTDLLRALVDRAAEISGKRYTASGADDDVSMRVIADHARTTAFLIAEGVFPEKGDREYVLRRVMRRAIRHGHRLGIARPFLHEVALACVDLMGEQYPELRERRSLVASVSEAEEVRFRETLERGIKLMDEVVARPDVKEARRIPGDVAFKLYDTFGFPVDLTEVIAREHSLDLDKEGYELALEEQKKRSEGSKVGEAALEDVWRDARAAVEKAGHAEVRFLGYEREEASGAVVALVLTGKDKALASSASAGDEVAFVTHQTPFYGESGGQVGDVGVARSASGAVVRVTDTQKPLDGLFVHFGKVESGAIAVGDELTLEVDHAARTATRRNHSATHILHWALRKVLGEAATQKGSLVAPDRLRFDFSHPRPVTAEELTAIEDLVNDKLLGDAPIVTEVLPIDEAKKRGAMAIFGDKYGATVRVLTMTHDSVELCGGTHARSLGEIGLFKIVSESGVAAGVRRIEGATGLNALAYVRELEGTLRAAGSLLKATPSDLADKVEKVIAHGKQLEKDLEVAKRKLAMGGSGGGDGGGGGLDGMLTRAREIPGGKALAVRVDAPDAAVLREMAEKLRDKLGEAVVLVGSVAGPKAMIALAVSKGLTDRYKAGDLIKPVAQVLGGSGGGRPDMAQAGGTQVDKLDEALEKLYAIVA